MEISIGATSLSKSERYKALYLSLLGLWQGESNQIANLANTSAAISQTFGFHWIGFYLADGDTLVLGPFQGPVACTRIGFGKGVCGTAWATKTTQLVADVDTFPGHIACSPHSRSEIVVPMLKENGEVWAVLDIDSAVLSDFDETDKEWLEKIAAALSRHSG